MQELPIEFIGKGEVKGFTFRQLDRSEFAYLYEVSYRSTVHYEVFERRVNELYDTETYPSSKVFGIWAKSTVNPRKARLYFQEYSDKGQAKKVAKTSIY